MFHTVFSARYEEYTSSEIATNKLTQPGKTFAIAGIITADDREEAIVVLQVVPVESGNHSRTKIEASRQKPVFFSRLRVER